MQRSDREFIEKYKQKQFEMRHPVPQKVTKEAAAPVAVQKVIKEDVPVAVQKVIKEDVPVAVQKVTKEDVPVAVQKVIKEDVQEVIKEAAPMAAQNDVQVAIQMVSSLKRQDDLADDKNQPNPLELIQSALQQINYALHLLNGVKKPSSQEIREKVTSDPILPEAQIVSEAILPEAQIVSEAILPEAQIVSEAILPEAQIVSEAILPEAQIVSEAILPEAQIVSEAILPIQNPIEPVTASDYISDVDVDVEVQKEEEFKIVMPKKLKNKKTVTTLLPVKEITKKDEFPSLGSSFAPVKKGFWSGTAKKSLEIAKSIAHIPSPPPISSPSPKLKKSIGMVRHGPSKDDLSEEEYSDTIEEYHIQKRYVEEDDDNWQ
jgi:hypothetical protein